MMNQRPRPDYTKKRLLIHRSAVTSGDREIRFHETKNVKQNSKGHRSFQMRYNLASVKQRFRVYISQYYLAKILT